MVLCYISAKVDVFGVRSELCLNLLEVSDGEWKID